MASITDVSRVPELLTPQQVAEILKVDRSTIIRWTKSGRLRVVRLSPETWRYRVEDVADLIDASP